MFELGLGLGYGFYTEGQQLGIQRREDLGLCLS